MMSAEHIGLNSSFWSHRFNNLSPKIYQMFFVIIGVRILICNYVSNVILTLPSRIRREISLLVWQESVIVLLAQNLISG